ncbi:MAG TPA: pectinesterase family protein, partial [Arachidicoccus sp.]|nr:pectinesterase family protein [Arachidicoccus sp.]
NLTIQNTAGKVGQAVALHVEADRSVFKNCNLVGNQDTLYAANEKSRQLYINCFIEGTTDFIFGEATALFKKCIIKSLSDSYITAAATTKRQHYGFVFDSCRLTSSPAVHKVYLGRPWRPYANVVFFHTWMGAHIRPEGWHNWGNKENEKTAFYAEYDNQGPGADISGRVGWVRSSKNLTKKDIKKYSLQQILGGNDHWSPLN